LRDIQAEIAIFASGMWTSEMRIKYAGRSVAVDFCANAMLILRDLLLEPPDLSVSSPQGSERRQSTAFFHSDGGKSPRPVLAKKITRCE